VIATRAGALPEIVGPEHCVTRGDALALAARMEELWDDPARRVDEGEAAIARAAAEFGEERYVHRLLALYDSL